MADHKILLENYIRMTYVVATPLQGQNTKYLLYYQASYKGGVSTMACANRPFL